MAAAHEGAEVIEADEVDVARLLSDRSATVGIDEVDAPKASVGLEVHQGAAEPFRRFREWFGREIHTHRWSAYSEQKAKVKSMVVDGFLATICGVLALSPAPVLGQRIGDAIRCEHSKCVSRPSALPADGPVIVKLLEAIREKELLIHEQQARIQELEKAKVKMTNKAEGKGRKAK